jgi:hypothetical protein
MRGTFQHGNREKSEDLAAPELRVVRSGRRTGSSKTFRRHPPKVGAV